MDIAEARLQEARRLCAENDIYEPDKKYYLRGDFDKTVSVKTALKLLNQFEWQPPIDPALLAAREYVSEVYNHTPEGRAAVNRGILDTAPTIKNFMAGVAWSRNKDSK